jgi:hypothetical protein
MMTDGFALYITLTAPLFGVVDLRWMGFQFLVGGVSGALSKFTHGDVQARRKERGRLESDLLRLRRQLAAALAQGQSGRRRSLAERVDVYNDEVRLLGARTDAAPFRAPELEALARRRSELIEEMRAAAGDELVLPPIR